MTKSFFWLLFLFPNFNFLLSKKTTLPKIFFFIQTEHKGHRLIFLFVKFCCWCDRQADYLKRLCFFLFPCHGDNRNCTLYFSRVHIGKPCIHFLPCPTYVYAATHSFMATNLTSFHSWLVYFLFGVLLLHYTVCRTWNIALIFRSFFGFLIWWSKRHTFMNKKVLSKIGEFTVMY